MCAVILIFSGMTTTLTACGKDDNNNGKVVPPAKEYFLLWNQCEAVTAPCITTV